MCVWGGGVGWGGVKTLLRPANFTLGPNVTLNTEKHKKFGSQKVTPILPTKFRVSWPVGSGEEDRKGFSR